MKKVAVFGKPGSGKSTISKALALATGIELHQLDSIVYKANGEFVEREVFDLAHDNIINSESWIIDGFGPLGSFNTRLEAADTLFLIQLATGLLPSECSKGCSLNLKAGLMKAQ